MLAGGGALIYTFARHEKSARDKLRIARAMQRSNERFRDLFDAHPVPMWIVEARTYRFVAVNPAALVHYGYNELEFLSMSVRDLHADNDFNRFATASRTPYASYTAASSRDRRARNRRQVSGGTSVATARR